MNRKNKKLLVTGLLLTQCSQSVEYSKAWVATSFVGTKSTRANLDLPFYPDRGGAQELGNRQVAVVAYLTVLLHPETGVDDHLLILLGQPFQVSVPLYVMLLDRNRK